MDKINILLTLYSIVAGLGISELMQGIGRMIQARDRIRLYWVHTAWLLIIFLAHVISWFALLRFAQGAHWTVFNSMLALLLPLILYLVSQVIVPEIDDDGRVDFREYYGDNCRWFGGLMIGFLFMGSVVQFAVERHGDWSGGGYLRLLAFIVLAIGVTNRRPAVHAAQAMALLAILAAGAALVTIELM